MKVMVTGGSGRLGQWVIRELGEHNYEVVNASRRPPQSPQRDQAYHAKYVQVDLCNKEQVMRSLDSCEAIIHLGAIPHPWGFSDAEIFRNNTLATYTVLSSAAEHHIKKIIFASSYTVYGTAFQASLKHPYYAPVDEEHPLCFQDVYSLSKALGETTVAAFAHRNHADFLVFRFLGIAFPGDMPAVIDALRADPSQGVSDLWSGYVDVRDAAMACRLALEVDGYEFAICNVGSADSLSDESTEVLIRRYCPDVEIRQSFEGSAWSNAKAHQIIGYVPRYSLKKS